MSHRKRSRRQPKAKAQHPRQGSQQSGKRIAAAVALVAVGTVVALWAVSGDRLATPTDDAGGSQPSPRGAAGGVEIPARPLRDSASVPVKLTSPDDLDDPAAEGWDTEVFSRAANAQLKALGTLLVGTQEIDASGLLPLVTADFTCPPLRPDELVTVFSDNTIRVERALADETGRGNPVPARHRGAEGLADALRTLKHPFVDAQDLRFKFKLIGVLPSADSVTTRKYFSVSGRTASGVVELNATWSARWQVSTKGEPPRLVFIRVEQFEQANAVGAGGPLFADCTESVLTGNDAYRAQICRGMNHWFKRGQDSGMWWGMAGVAIGDVNGDALDDLYLCQEWGLPNRLFVQNPDGTLRDTSVEAGVDWLRDARSPLLVDLDNDGDQDLVVAVHGGVVLAANDGTGNFITRGVLDVPGGPITLSAIDYDRDGRLDLYVCVYEPDDISSNGMVASRIGASGGIMVHDANNGGANRLFRNQIDEQDRWQLVDVTEKTGLDVNNRRWSLAAAWEDFDNDGDQDLYVANDFGRNCLYRNDQQDDGTRRFVDIAASAGVEDSASGMSVTWGDYDRDGLMDVYVSNMFSAAGKRIAFQDRFKPDSTAEVKARLQRFARGNTLLNNRGDGTFVDTSEEAAVTVGRWAWGSNFVDVNNDGWEDLVVANGQYTGEDSGDL